MQQCHGHFRERDFNNDPETIATIVRSVKTGTGRKRRKERSLLPVARVFRKHFPIFALYYITESWSLQQAKFHMGGNFTEKFYWSIL